MKKNNVKNVVKNYKNGVKIKVALKDISANHVVPYKQENV